MGQRMIRRQVDEGLQFYSEKNYENAIKKWTIALQKMKDNRLRFSTLNYLALASRDRGRNKDFLVYSVQQIDVAHEIDENHFRAEAYLNLSRANELIGDYFKAVSYSRSVLQYSSNKDPLQGYAFAVMAQAYIGLSNFSKAIECLDRAWTISNEQLDRLMEIEALTVMGKIYMLLKDFRKALAFQRRAHELSLSQFAESKGEILEKFVRSTKLDLATVLRLLGHFDEASKCIEETMRAASSLSDRPVQAKCLISLGDIQRSQKNNEVACKKYEAAIQMLQEMSDRSNSILAMMGLVKALLGLDTPKQMASEILNNALSTATTMANKLTQARLHLLNQRLFDLTGYVDQAQQVFQSAQRLFQEADLICSICQLPIGYQPDNIQILTCNHLFHQNCVQNLIHRWTHQPQSCPKCHKNVLFTRTHIALCCS